MHLDRDRAGEAVDDGERATSHAEKAPELTLDLNSRATRETVMLAHLLILGRPPRNEHHIKKGLECGTIGLLREYLLNSRHFQQQKRQAAQRPFLFFIHIPKTAGGSLRRYFKTTFGSGCQFFMRNERGQGKGHIMRRGVEFDVEEHLANYRISGGHIPFDHVPQGLLEADPIFVSVLRDPLQRALSYYNFLRTQKRPPREEAQAAFAEMKKLTLYQTLTANKRSRTDYDRVQIRFLCGRPDTEALREVLKAHRFILGKQEHLGEFMNLLHEMLGLPLVPSDTKQIHKSSSDYQTALAAQPHYDEAVEMIRSMNAEEYEFYNSFGPTWTNMRPNLALKRPGHSPAPAARN
ncbi:MAG: sulfotransferase family 2 domain-containing protein [Alphaproteobacteria bacterium]|nr:sulfotransferase family 2 domain-containing protein [Alphaproteobacteria bacterium]